MHTHTFAPQTHTYIHAPRGLNKVSFVIWGTFNCGRKETTQAKDGYPGARVMEAVWQVWLQHRTIFNHRQHYTTFNYSFVQNVIIKT